MNVHVDKGLFARTRGGVAWGPVLAFGDRTRNAVFLSQYESKSMVAWLGPACFGERKDTTFDSDSNLSGYELFIFT